jgi:hypothetical protein
MAYQKWVEKATSTPGFQAVGIDFSNAVCHDANKINRLGA